MDNAPDILEVAGNVYNFKMENDRIRVFEVIFNPKDVAKMHHHPDHLIYVIKGGKLKLTSEGKTDVLNLETGKAMFLNAQNHEAENVGDGTIDLLVVELKK